MNSILDDNSLLDLGGELTHPDTYKPLPSNLTIAENLYHFRLNEAMIDKISKIRVLVTDLGNLPVVSINVKVLTDITGAMHDNFNVLTIGVDNNEN